MRMMQEKRKRRTAGLKREQVERNMKNQQQAGKKETKRETRTDWLVKRTVIKMKWRKKTRKRRKKMKKMK